MKGLGTDEAKIIETLTSCNAEQRQEIKIKFKSMYGKVRGRGWELRACVVQCARLGGSASDRWKCF